MNKKDKIEIKMILAKKDLSGTDYENPTTISVVTEYNSDTQSFIFSAVIPKYLYDGVVDKEEKYGVELTKKYNKEKEYHESKKKLFGNKITSIALSGIINQLEDINNDAMRYHELTVAESSKWLAIKWSNSHNQQRDNYNFANMGKRVTSIFQWFVAYKIEANKESLSNDRLWKSKTQMAYNQSSIKDSRDWYYYGRNLDKDSSIQLIPWTQEREDYLKKIENKFVDLNKKLDEFLKDLDENKLELLMRNSNFLLE